MQIQGDGNAQSAPDAQGISSLRTSRSATPLTTRLCCWADLIIVTAPIRVTVWGENFHERSEPDKAGMAERYPRGMHGAIAAGLAELLGDSVAVSTSTQDQPEHGLTEEVLARTDVLTWWGHATHSSVDNAVVDRVHQRVLGGMGLLVLHSAHFSKIFRQLMGTTCSLAWRNSGDTELIWTVNPSHPIAAGIPHPIVIEEHEMYGEYFDIPAPEELIFLSTFSSGEVFRSGCCWRRGKGKVFYFSPGDQEYPVYNHPDIKRVLANAVQWARPDSDTDFVAPAVTSRPAPYFDRRVFAGGVDA
jgi:trehalose utilization protein